jgi:hypothetical protein
VAKLVPRLTGWHEFVVAVDKVKKLIRGVISEHKEKYENNHLRDFMDVYLAEVHGTTDAQSSFYKNVGGTSGGEEMS